jgi:putative oxidoreductase
MTRLNALQPVGLLLLRLALGIIFIWHGYPKLTHPNAMQGLFVQHGLPGYFVTVAGVLEVFGGALIILGFLTRIAALLLAMEMAVSDPESAQRRGIYGGAQLRISLGAGGRVFRTGNRRSRAGFS